MVNQSWNDRKFQIHWKNVELVNPINRSEGKNLFCASSKKFYLKDNDKTSYQVGHSNLKPLGLEKILKIKIMINELEASLTRTIIEQSDYSMKNNPDFSVVVEVANADADLTSGASKANEKYDDMNISDE